MFQGTELMPEQITRTKTKPNKSIASTFFKGLVACLLLPSFVSIASEKQNNLHSNVLNYKDIFELEYAASPQILSNGKSVIYERRSLDIMTDGTRTNIWQVDLNGENNRPLLSGKNSFRMPRLSPDSKRLAYLSSVEGNTQLYVRWLDTGQTIRVTNLEKSPSAITWSPDGKSIAFAMFKPSKPSSLFTEMPKKPKGAKWAGDATYIDRTNYRSNNQGFIPSGYQHIYVVTANGGTARQITSGDFHHGGPLTWTLDSKHIIFDGDRNEEWEYRPVESDVYSVNVSTKEIVNITDRKGPEFNAKLSPNGKKLAYIQVDDRKLSSQNSYLVVRERKGKSIKKLTHKLDRSISQYHWAKNGKGLYFSYDDHGQKTVAYVDLKGKIKPLNINLGGQSLGRPYTSGEFSVSKNNDIVFTLANARQPADLAVAVKGGKDIATQLTFLNDDLFAHIKVAAVKPLTVKSSIDKRDIEAWVAFPPNFDKTKKYPLILEIHGGPHAAYGPNYSTEVQIMAAKGYVVVWANPRGSTSYGEEFANLIHHNYPSQDYNDLMDVVDGVIEEGYVDKEQLFVTGGSGGGVLTAWIVGKTNRFKAAVVAKPVINWISFSLTADGYTYYTQYWMPGKPWEQFEHLWKHSPLSLVGNVTTPTMLLTGEVDYRTPMSETEQYYQALQLQKVDTAMVRIKKAHHGIAARPSNLIQKMGYILSWFEKYSKQKE